MTNVSVPCVMISSTCYDLHQVRADLEQFITCNLGYQALLSEYRSFPIDPDKTTIENCRNRVLRSADILVLILGGRYGSVDGPTNKSITNLEYLAARAKGIPIYVFVERRTLQSLSLWQANPDGDFSSVVDSVRVFEFVQDIRTTAKVWVFEFATAQDIIESLRLQFAHLFHEGLNLAAKVRRTDIDLAFAALSGKAFVLALERPTDWEYRLFFQVLQDEISACKLMKTKYEMGFALGAGENVSLQDFAYWYRPRMDELRRAADALMGAVNVALPEAIGAPGEAGNAEEIINVAHLMGEIYKEALEWSQRVRRATSHPALQPAISAMARFPDDILTRVESLGCPMLQRVEQALATATKGEPVIIDARFKVELSHLEEFTKAIEQLERDVESGRI